MTLRPAAKHADRNSSKLTGREDPTGQHAGHALAVLSAIKAAPASFSRSLPPPGA